jgi:hypothetical protein
MEKPLGGKVQNQTFAIPASGPSEIKKQQPGAPRMLTGTRLCRGDMATKPPRILRNGLRCELQEQIRRRAYEMYEQCGRDDGMN